MDQDTWGISRRKKRSCHKCCHKGSKGQLVKTDTHVRFRAPALNSQPLCSDLNDLPQHLGQPSLKKGGAGCLCAMNLFNTKPNMVQELGIHLC